MIADKVGDNKRPIAARLAVYSYLDVGFDYILE